MSSRPPPDPLRLTLADIRRSKLMKRKMSLPNARRLYLRRARHHATVADITQIIAVYR